MVYVDNAMEELNTTRPIRYILLDVPGYRLRNGRAVVFAEVANSGWFRRDRLGELIGTKIEGTTLVITGVESFATAYAQDGDSIGLAVKE